MEVAIPNPSATLASINFRGVLPRRTEKYPLNLIQVMLAKGKVTEPGRFVSVVCAPKFIVLTVTQLPSSCMVLYVNDKPHEAPEAPTLFATLDELALTPLRGIAVAVNDEVIARPDWPTFQLRPQDRLTIIRATQGG